MCIFILRKNVYLCVSGLKSILLFFNSPLLVRTEQAPPGQIFKVKTGWAHKKLRGGGGVATSVRGEGGRDERRELGEKRGGNSCRNESGHC